MTDASIPARTHSATRPQEERELLLIKRRCLRSHSESTVATRNRQTIQHSPAHRQLTAPGFQPCAVFFFSAFSIFLTFVGHERIAAI